MTWKRLRNLYLSRYEYHRGLETLKSFPIRLTIEPINACNLRCPGCFTGRGAVARPRMAMPMKLYRGLLDELGDFLFGIELANWGEPLLNKDLFTMIREAHDRGISTTISTHFSVPFDANRAEELVSSGLTILGVSLDGLEQKTYEQYRVKGNLARVLENCRLVAEAKRKLKSETPRVICEFHVFEHNVHEVPSVGTLARELGMETSITKGWTAGEEWDSDGPFSHGWDPYPNRCVFLWQFAVVNNDGGVAPCCGTFYREDDVGTLVSPDGEGYRPFRDVWNGPLFRQARHFYRVRERSAEKPDHVCFDCPQTGLWERWLRHRSRGGTWDSFEVGYTTNDSFNYFLSRGPQQPDTKRVADGRP